jgi:multiple sugar transport system ATP-binding protein
LPLAAVPAEATGRPAVYGIRPEHLHLSPDGIPLRVMAVEPTGSETLVVVEHGDHQLTALLRERVSLRRDEIIHLRPDAGMVHLFDKATGKRLV